MNLMCSETFIHYNGKFAERAFYYVFQVVLLVKLHIRQKG